MKHGGCHLFFLDRTMIGILSRRRSVKHPNATIGLIIQKMVVNKIYKFKLRVYFLGFSDSEILLT